MTDKERETLINELRECRLVPMPDYSKYTNEKLMAEAERMKIIEEVSIQAFLEGNTDDDDL